MDVQDRDLAEEIRKSFLDYGMSVLVARALPDVRDGLKPVHRRILWSMWENGFTSDSQFRKCARIVGDVLGHYHPHGDAAVYLTMVRMAQDFAMNIPLIEGHGNFGSRDGDSPAALRYTEARLSKASWYMLNGIDRDAVSFVPNFDGDSKEPTVLPASFPNLLVNGTQGIAVGMATRIPPHNLGEVISATIALAKNPNISTSELMEHVLGPDFPTYGEIVGQDGYRQAYETGRGSVLLRGKAVYDESRSSIIITELPYEVSNSSFVVRLADLVKEKVIEDVVDLRDESDLSGISIVIRLKRHSQPKVVMSKIAKHTDFQKNISIILLALKDGRPRIMGLKEMLEAYIDHYIDVLTNIAKYDLREKEAELHKLLGYIAALDMIDETIAVIKKSNGPKEARDGLIALLGVDESQARAILDLRLQSLTSLNQDALRKDCDAARAETERLKTLLSDRGNLVAVMIKNLKELSAKLATPRKSKIVADDTNQSEGDLINRETSVISLTKNGYIKRTPESMYRQQKRMGKGSSGHAKKDSDQMDKILVVDSHSTILIVTNKGRLYYAHAFQIPDGDRDGRGTPVVNILPLRDDETVRSILPIPESKDGDLLFVTKNGIVNKQSVAECMSKIQGVNALTLKGNDELVDVVHLNGIRDVMLVLASGKASVLVSDRVRATKRGTMGVIGMRMSKDDSIVSVLPYAKNGNLFIILQSGIGKIVAMDKFPIKKGVNSGVVAINTKDGDIVASALFVQPPASGDIMVLTKDSQVIRVGINEVPVLERASRGNKIINLSNGDIVIDASYVPNSD